jgi:hypothetical protein
MVSYYDKVRLATRQTPLPLIAKLNGVFESLNDNALLTALKGKVHRGCQGYSVKALWRSYLLSYVLNIPTVASLIRTLQNSPVLCQACGIQPTAIPSEATYSRFVAKLAKHKNLVEAVMKDGVERLGLSLPDFGQIVAIDSTDIVAYSQSRKPSDTDAKWSKKRNKHGRDHWWFGCKAHIVCDATYELPIHIDVTPANVSDSKSLIPVLTSAMVEPQAVLADAGYDAVDNYRFVDEELKALPIIKLNKRRGKRKSDKPIHRSKEQIAAMMLREHPGIDRDSIQFAAHYAARVSIERLTSRMKEFRRLASVHHRGLAKVTLHVYLSTLIVVASACSAIYFRQPVRQVA